MKRSVWFNVLLVITLVVMAFDGYIWLYTIVLAKNTDFRYRPAGLGELYIPAEMPSITALHVVGRKVLKVVLDPAPPVTTRWLISTDEGNVVRSEGRYPQLILADKEHLYRVRREGAGGSKLYDFTLRVDYFPRELYQKANPGLDDTFRIISSSLPVGVYRKHPLAAFVDDGISPADRREAARIVRDEIGIREAEPTKKKIEKIGLFILTRLDGIRVYLPKG